MEEFSYRCLKDYWKICIFLKIMVAILRSHAWSVIPERVKKLQCPKKTAARFFFDQFVKFNFLVSKKFLWRLVLKL